MNDNYTPQFWISASTLVWNILLGAYVWFVSREKATRAEIKAVRDDVQGLKGRQAENCSLHLARTTTLEERAKNAPTHADIGQVHDRITKVSGGVDELKGMLRGVTSNVNLLVEHHLRGEGK